MIYISMPVHENVPVIVDQLRNFAKFCPASAFVLHISLSATFEPDTLRAALAEASLNNVILNPRRVPTGWASIINAHLANIELIEELGDAESVVFHSSNDMLVRAGADHHIAASGNIFHLRPVLDDSHWWVGNEAAADDVLRRALAQLGSCRVVASQIEGSCYQAAVIFEIAKAVKKTGAHLGRQFYPREEIILPSFAVALGVAPTAQPYVYSEVHAFDKRLWRFFDRADIFIDRPNAASRLLKQFTNLAYFKFGSHRLSVSDVDQVASGSAAPSEDDCWMHDGRSGWKVFGSPAFGVKRVARTFDDPVRSHIRRLS